MKVSVESNEQTTVTVEFEAKGTEFTLCELALICEEMISGGFGPQTCISVWQGDDDEGEIARAQITVGGAA